MRFSPSFLDEIKARLPVSQVVGRRVRLVKSGREWKGLSPFNAEKDASFFVNDQKQAWFDFSSGKNGNVFDFVIESEGLTFPEAVERLAAEAGLELPARNPEGEKREKERLSLLEVMEMAATYFEAVLKEPRGAWRATIFGPRPFGEEPRRVSAGLRAARASRVARPSRRQGRSTRRHGGGRALGFRPRHPRRL